MTEPKTDTLAVPGAVLHYDVRPADLTTADSGTRPADGALETTPDEHADDLHRLITALTSAPGTAPGSAPADIFATSGGAVNALVLVSKHPEQVRTLIAHEPPASRELPDSGPVLAASVDIHDTYQRAGFGPAMAKFIAMVSQRGPFPADYADRPDPDPAAFGLPTQDDGSRSDPLVGQNMISCSHYEHDFGALRAAPTRVVIGVGEESGQMVPGRAAAAVAGRLGTDPITFPGGHDGFLGGEFGRTGKTGRLRRYRP